MKKIWGPINQAIILWLKMFYTYYILRNNSKKKRKVFCFENYEKYIPIESMNLIRQQKPNKIIILLV